MPRGSHRRSTSWSSPVASYGCGPGSERSSSMSRVTSRSEESRGCSGSPSTRSTRRTGSSISPTPRATAKTPSLGTARTAGRPCEPAARSCSPSRTRTETTTAASSPSAATGCCTPPSATADRGRSGGSVAEHGLAVRQAAPSRRLEAGADWAIAGLGLRNAWRFSFDRVTGDLYLGDVGQGAIEEVSFTPRESPGLENYGWDLYEGSRRFEGGEPAAGKLVFPVYEYGRDEGNCTVIGGHVYRGSTSPAERGRYIFGDYCSGIVWSLNVRSGAARNVRREPFRIQGLTSFGESTSGRALRHHARRRHLPTDLVTAGLELRCEPKPRV